MKKKKKVGSKIMGVMLTVCLCIPLLGVTVQAADMEPDFTGNYAFVDSKVEKCDLYLPDGEGPFPVVIFLTGGAWLMTDKSGRLGNMNAGEVFNVAPYLLDRGYAVLAISYSSIFDSKMPRQIDETQAAIRWTKNFASRFNLDKNRIALWGCSAGGYEVNVTGCLGAKVDCGDWGYGNLFEDNSVDAVVDFYGVVDFNTIEEQSQYDFMKPLYQTAQKCLFGSLVKDSQYWSYFSDPKNYIRSDAPAYFIAHGTTDSLVPYQQSVDFANALSSVLGEEKVEFVSIEGAEHASEPFFTDEVLGQACDFLDAHLN